MRRILYIIIASICCINISIGQTFLKVRQVYDFQIGDEFYYKYILMYPYKIGEKRKVIEKQVSTNNDTITYTFECKSYKIETINNYDSIQFSYFTQTNKYFNLDSTMYHYWENSMILSSDSISLTPSITYKDLNNVLVDSYLNYLRLVPQKSYDLHYYSAGLGCVLAEVFTDDVIATYKSNYIMTAYKKKGNSFGVPDSLLSGTSIITENDIEIFPNPSQSLITIKSSNQETLQFEIYNELGLKVIDSKFHKNMSTIDISNLASGIYICLISSKYGMIQKKIIKI